MTANRDSLENAIDALASVAVQLGVNIQPGQTLSVSASVSSVEFVRRIVHHAYRGGAKHVYVDWYDEEVTRTKYLLAPEDAFAEFPQWRADGHLQMAKSGAAFLSVLSPVPDFLTGVNPVRIATSAKTSSQAMEAYHEYVENDWCRWSIVAVPNVTWARKLFPNQSDEEAVRTLWDYILRASRVAGDNPVAAWREHADVLKQRVQAMNELRLKKLHYTAPGTDLTVLLPEKHLWLGAGAVDREGIEFLPNIPTEEVFTAPLKRGVNGVVSSTKPLEYRGSVIEDFRLTFSEGRIVKVEAARGQETLERLVDTDEGAHYLGEIALVPHKSPISDMGILFYETLFDENASNHLAIGQAYPTCIEGGADLNKAEQEAVGINSSLTHVDFMIGSADMNIAGETQDGRVVQVFERGDWAF